MDEFQDVLNSIKERFGIYGGNSKAREGCPCKRVRIKREPESASLGAQIKKRTSPGCAARRKTEPNRSDDLHNFICLCKMKNVVL
jgi:hypothetical protein